MIFKEITNKIRKIIMFILLILSKIAEVLDYRL